MKIRSKSKWLVVIMLVLYILIINFSALQEKVYSQDEIIKVVDSLEREVKITKKPEKIGCLSEVSAHIISMLDKKSEIVAVSAGSKRSKLYLKISPQVKKATVLRGNGKKLNIEELLKVKPDILLLQKHIVKDKSIVERLEQFEIPYLVVEFTDMAEEQDAIEMLGKVMGREEKAEAFNDYYNQIIKEVASRVEKISQSERKNLYHAINEILRADVAGTLCENWIKVTGVENVSLEGSKRAVLEKDKYYIGIEQLLLWNPDTIIINGSEAIKKDIFKNNQFKDLKAVKNKEVYIMPVGISRWGHTYSIETPLAILWLAKTLYPTHFEDIDLIVEVKDFYKKFYNYEVSDKVAAKILAGTGLREFKKNKHGSGRSKRKQSKGEDNGTDSKY